MSLEEFIETIEDDYLQEDLESLAAKDRIMVYLSAKEFFQYKLQRQSAAPVSEEGLNFTVEHVIDAA